METKWLNTFALVAAGVAVTLVALHNLDFNSSHELLNASYAPTGDLYKDIDRQFVADYAKQNGLALTIKQSHGGSSRQAKAVINGLDADVVTLALPSDVDSLRKQGLISEGWQQRLPNNSQPYTSTIVFVVRKGNPKAIKDWPDLVSPGVEIVTPNPKTSGNGKLSLLAAWGSVLYRGGTEDQAREYIRQLYEHVSVLGTSATDSTASFAYDKIGDVHLTWENEAIREAAESKGSLEIVYPPVSILAEPYVAWVDMNVQRHGSLEDARQYLEFLFSDAAQEIVAEMGYRPYQQPVAHNAGPRLPPIVLFPISAIARDWDDAQEKFFAEGGLIEGALKESRP
jgi:sulfate/thiosulfate-binding protein